MPRISSTFTLSNAADGAMDSKHIIDCAAALSAYYGKLIRQGNAFRIKSYSVRVFNPNTLVQDENLAVAGKLVYYEPTGNRKSAWKKAFRATQHQRKLIGISEKAYDFRVGLHSAYPEVPQQAWIRGQDESLVLGSGSTDRNGIFAVHNAGLVDDTLPEDSEMNGFGTPYDVAAVILAEGDLDFKEGTGDAGFYTPGTASQLAAVLPFQVAASGVYDSSNQEVSTWTTAQVEECNATAMCGLVGIVIDTTMPDDTVAQTQDVGVEITLDIESWSSLFPKKKKSRSKKNAGSKRRRKSKK